MTGAFFRAYFLHTFLILIVENGLEIEAGSRDVVADKMITINATRHRVAVSEDQLQKSRRHFRLNMSIERMPETIQRDRRVDSRFLFYSNQAASEHNLITPHARGIAKDPAGRVKGFRFFDHGFNGRD